MRQRSRFDCVRGACSVNESPQYRTVVTASTGKIEIKQKGFEMTEQQANEMIRKICEWLEAGAPGATRAGVYESVPADIARDMCGELLSSAKADDMGGCMLCQS